jgi:uncharacterized protein
VTKASSPLIWLGAVLAFGAAAITVAMHEMIRRRLFQTGQVNDIARQHGLFLEHVEFSAVDGVRLHGWFYKAPQPKAVILFMHGTSYNVLDLLSEPERAELFSSFLEQLGCDWLMFDYRGYGPSEGRPSEGGLYRDAEAAIAYLRSREDVDASRLVLYGFSLGSAVATEMAVRHPCLGLVLRAPFSSIREMSETRVPLTRYLHSFLPWLPGTRFDTVGKIVRVRAPLLVMHGDRDATVPTWMARRVYEAAGTEAKRFVELRDAAHGDFPIEQMVEAINGFLDSLGEELVVPAARARGLRFWDASGDIAGEHYARA